MFIYKPLFFCYSVIGATITVGGSPSSGAFLPPDERKGVELMISYPDLFQFVIMITAIAALFLQIGKRK